MQMTRSGFSLSISNDWSVVLAVRDTVIPGGRFAEMLLEKGQRLRPEIRAGPDAEALHPTRGDRPDAEGQYRSGG